MCAVTFAQTLLTGCFGWLGPGTVSFTSEHERVVPKDTCFSISLLTTSPPPPTYFLSSLPILSTDPGAVCFLLFSLLPLLQLPLQERGAFGVRCKQTHTSISLPAPEKGCENSSQSPSRPVPYLRELALGTSLRQRSAPPTGKEELSDSSGPL